MMIGQSVSTYPSSLGAVFASGGWSVPNPRESASRAVFVAIAKTLSFAAVHFVVAFTVVFALTGNVLLGGMVALIEPACNVVAYYLHEKAWTGINDARFHPYQPSR